MSSPGAPPEGQAPGTRAPRPAVLVVNDVEANLIALEALLNDLGCEVVRARSGNAALSLLLKRDYALMLLDVQMPEMDGYEVARHARANPITRDVPILFLTATHNTEDNVLKGYGSGAVNFLFKPLNSTILRSKVRVFLELSASKRQIADGKRELETAYHELQDAQAQLIQSAKMASLGELVAGIAHEINNPLAFALSHLETARRCLVALDAALSPASHESSRPDWEKLNRRVSEMDLGLTRIRDLVVKLRTFSRLDGGERGRVSVRASVESVLTILNHRLRDRVRIETELEEPDELECYPGLLNQALMNLIANAIDAVESEGVVTVRGGAKGGEYVVAVEDTGPGIPFELRQRIFEPFFTTKPVGAGTGLGLSITYSIAEKHGGRLDVECPPSGGTIMTMRLSLSLPARGSNDA